MDVDKFTYLGSTLSRGVHIDDEVTARIAKASVAFRRLRANVWERNGINFDTKLKVYKVVVLLTLWYACETWTVYQRHAKRPNHFHLSCLRKLLKIKWQDKIPDTEVLKKAGMQSMHTVFKLAQRRWTGHVIRMPDERLPSPFSLICSLLLKDLSFIFISKESLLWRTTGGKALSRRPEETLQRHPQSLSEGFRHTNEACNRVFWDTGY